MFSRRTQFVPKGEGVRVLLKRQNRRKFMIVDEPQKITFCHRQWKRKYILYQTFSKICKKSMFWANLRNVKGGKLLSEKDVVGPTHVYSFKSGAIFDQGENKREIARLNENKKTAYTLQIQAGRSPKTFCNLSSWVSDIARAGLAKLAKPRWVLQVAKLLNSCSQTLLPDPEAAASPDQRQICHYLPNICSNWLRM